MMSPSNQTRIEISHLAVQKVQCNAMLYGVMSILIKHHKSHILWDPSNHAESSKKCSVTFYGHI